MATQRTIQLTQNGVPVIEHPYVKVDPAARYVSYNPYKQWLVNSLPLDERPDYLRFESTALPCGPALCTPLQYSRGCRSVVTDKNAICVSLGATIDYEEGTASKMCAAPGS